MNMGKRITIDPITRLEGHGRIDIFLDGSGAVEKTRLQVPDFRGFEKFCEGRAAEEMPTLTQKICGVCPTAHHVASSRALDDLFDITPPAIAVKIRELMQSAFLYEDHLLHFYVLGGPDWIVGPGAPVERRNLFGVIDRLGEGTGKRFLGIRKRVRRIQADIGGSPLYPVCGLPGGVSRTISARMRDRMRATAREAVDFADETLALFTERVLRHKSYAELMRADAFRHRIYSMGLVDAENRINFYDGQLRVVDPSGKEFARFSACDYMDHLAERVDPASYQKLVYLKSIGWKAGEDGASNGIYRVGPLGRLNAADGMATPRAQAEYERMEEAFGGWPVHNLFAYHWARLIEVMYAAERMVELAEDTAILGKEVRRLPVREPHEGIGVCEAPRGTLIHHYTTDSRAIVQRVNLLVATQNNAAAIGMSIEKSARAILADGVHTDARLNLIEMVFRAYDPCLACAAH